mgnify:CR=1 FL=1
MPNKWDIRNLSIMPEVFFWGSHIPNSPRVNFRLFWLVYMFIYKQSNMTLHLGTSRGIQSPQADDRGPLRVTLTHHWSHACRGSRGGLQSGKRRVSTSHSWTWARCGSVDPPWAPPRLLRVPCHHWTRTCGGLHFFYCYIWNDFRKINAVSGTNTSTFLFLNCKLWSRSGYTTWR